jgi:hypothetical protein
MRGLQAEQASSPSCSTPQVATLADKGYRGARGAVGVPFHGRNLPDRIREVNSALAKVQSPIHRRTCGGHAEDLAPPGRAPLLPTARHGFGRGDPDPCTSTHDHELESAQGLGPPTQRRACEAGPQHAGDLDDHSASSIGAPLMKLAGRDGSRLCTFGALPGTRTPNPRIMSRTCLAMPACAV